MHPSWFLNGLTVYDSLLARWWDLSKDDVLRCNLICADWAVESEMTSLLLDGLSMLLQLLPVGHIFNALRCSPIAFPWGILIYIQP